MGKNEKHFEQLAFDFGAGRQDDPEQDIVIYPREEDYLGISKTDISTRQMVLEVDPEDNTFDVPDA